MDCTPLKHAHGCFSRRDVLSTDTRLHEADAGILQLRLVQLPDATLITWVCIQQGFGEVTSIPWAQQLGLPSCNAVSRWEPSQ